MDLVSKLSDAIKPHSISLGMQANNIRNLLDTRLCEILDELRNIGRPDYLDKWQYCDFATTGAVAAGSFQEFVMPLVVPANEVWLVQAIIVNGPAASISFVTDGQQPRGAIQNTTWIQSIGGNIAFLPGEHIGIAFATGATVGTISVIRKQTSTKPKRVAPGDAGEAPQFTGTNTHETARDNLDQRGVYESLPPEVRDTMGTWRNAQAADQIGNEKAIDNKDFIPTPEPF